MKKKFSKLLALYLPYLLLDLRQRISVRHGGWLKAKRWEIRFCL